MRLLALLLLVTAGVAGACPALAEVTILRGSSAPPPAAPPAEPVPVVVREIVYTPVYYASPLYIAVRPHHIVQPAPAPVALGVTSGGASGWPLFGPSSSRR